MQRLLLTAALILGGASGALAHQDPPGCQGTGANVQGDVFFADGVSDATGTMLSECETVVYRATVCHPGGNRCNMQGGSLTITTPDGAVHDVTPAGGVPLLTSGSCVSGPDITYTVSAADVAGGMITTAFDYDNGIGHTGNTHSTASGGTNLSNGVVACDDGVFCNGLETCDPEQFDPTGTRQGVCEDGTPPTCDDDNACTADSCDPATDACVNATISCDDTNACTADSCDPATGCVNATISCDDTNACTADSCDPATGCVNATISCDDTNACTADSCDPATGCVNATISCDDTNACTADSCNPATGCVNATISCDDTNACTADSCDPATGCVNATISCDDTNACTADSCDPASGCVNTTISCDDSNACTADSCDPASGCVNATISCDDTNACTADSCDPATGCVNTTISCGDNNACTTDSCDPASGCVNTTIVCDDNNVCNGPETCDPTNGCQPGTPLVCGDNNACNGTETCDPTLGCQPGTPVVCDDGASCTTDACSTETGECVFTPDDTVCDDQEFCTDNVCDPTDETADPETGCVITPGGVGEPCDDGNACTEGEVCCDDGTCGDATAVTCEDDGNICTTEFCDSNIGCTFVNNSNDCNDGDACTTDDFCRGGECQGGTALTCGDNNGCTADSCDPATGCVFDPVPQNGQPCTDDNACTSFTGTPGPDACSNGTCLGTPATCNDNNECTDDTCDPATGCVFTNNTAPCTDNDACTSFTGQPGPDQCSGGTCHGDPITCNDNNECTDDTCDPATGCVFTNNTAPCTDNDACTSFTGQPGPDQCSGGTCHGDPITCNDNNECTDDTCDPATGCVFTNNTAPCTDNDACTSFTGQPGPDQCSGGTCHGDPITCNDNDPCTTDSCDGGCVFDPIPNCGGCPTDCNDNNDCTADSCVGTTCVNDPVPQNGEPCQDGNPCTSDDGTEGNPDQCLDGNCTGVPVNCDDNNECTADSCAAGECVHDTSGSGTGDSESRAYGVQANVPALDPLQPVIDALISPNPGPLLIDATPDTDLPGGAPSPFLEIPADPALHVNVLTASAHQATTATDASSDATATTADVHLLDSGTGFLINANAVLANVDCNADGTTAGSSSAGSMIEGLTIGGQNFDTITEPTSIVITEPITKAKVEVHLLEQIESGAKAGDIQPNPETQSFESDLTVNGIHVKVTDPSGAIIADIIVAHAECKASFGPVCEEFPHVSGKGYVVGVNADEVLIDPLNQLLNNEIGSVRLPSTGGSDDATLKHIGPIGQDTNILVESNTAFSHTEGTVDSEGNTASSETISQVEDLSLIDTGAEPTDPFIKADLVRAECESSAGPGATDGSSSGSTTIAGLSIGGQDVCEALGLAPTPGCPNDVICCEPPPNTDVCAALSLTPLCDGLGLSITLNEQKGTTSGNPTDITTNAIHVHLGGVIPGDNGVDVIVSSAHCDAGGAGTGEPPPPYASAAPLHRAPDSMLAFLFGTGAVGLLIPRRNRSKRP